MHLASGSHDANVQLSADDRGFDRPIPLVDPPRGQGRSKSDELLQYAKLADMNITQDLSIIELVINASLVVKLVMLLLTLVSLTSWYWIFRKAFAIRDARSKTDKFERDFWSGGDLNALYQSAVNNRHQTGALERIFEAGYREFTKLRGQKIIDPTAVIDGARRAMRATYQREIDDLEAHLAFLASVGSVSPYVGLFGTVWGIMHAFRGLANMSTATLSAVAPGIAEALVATAIGLFAAIPAVIAYNRFAHDVDRVAVRFESFMEEFSNILQRQTR
jgi:biopolymer transport protein TolQ